MTIMTKVLDEIANAITCSIGDGCAELYVSVWGQALYQLLGVLAPSSSKKLGVDSAHSDSWGQTYQSYNVHRS